MLICLIVCLLASQDLGRSKTVSVATEVANKKWRPRIATLGLIAVRSYPASVAMPQRKLTLDQIAVHFDKAIVDAAGMRRPFQERAAARARGGGAAVVGGAIVLWGLPQSEVVK